MPLCTNPNKTAKYWLRVDDDAPLATRPVFLVRFMTDLEHTRHQELWKTPATTAQETWAQWEEMIGIGIVGWQNVKDADGNAIPYSVDAAFNLLTDQEKWELAQSYPDVVRVTRRDRKNFESQPSSVTAGSAEAAKTSV